MPTKPQRVIGSLGLSPAELTLLAELGHEQGWDVQEGGDGADLVLAAVDASLEAMERSVRQGRLTLALLDPQGAAQVAPCFRAGALDCLVRPLEAYKTTEVLKRCLELGQLARDVAEHEDRLWRDLPGTRLVGESPALAAALGQAVQAAEFPVDVLILGETGTGKELLARVIHERSGQRMGPFVAVDCGAINPDLADSALFGHRRGAFTGAHQDHVGLLEQADGGILFLDEVANLSQAVQAKLLRALQNREVWRLGDTVAKPVEFRVLAATHADLEIEVAEGRFRSDLYHRLADLKVQLPPLRERGGDVELLARLFLGRHRSRYGLEACNFSSEAMALLRRYDWPGNVRQLDNALKQAALLAAETLLPEHLPQEVQAGPTQRVSVPGSITAEAEVPEGLMPLWQLEQNVTRLVESRAIQAALAQAGQDRDKAAAILELHPKTLARKMRIYGL